jgi:hypothetical protein
MPAWCPGGRTTQNAFRQRPATTCGSNKFTCKPRVRVPPRTRHTCPLPRNPAHVAREHATRYAQHCTTLREHNSAPVGCRSIMRCVVRRCGSHAYAMTHLVDRAAHGAGGVERGRVRLLQRPRRARARVCARVSACVCARVCARVSACVCARVCVRVRASVRRCALTGPGAMDRLGLGAADLVKERVAHQRVLALCLGHVPDLPIASRRRCTGTGTR